MKAYRKHELGVVHRHLDTDNQCKLVVDLSKIRQKLLPAIHQTGSIERQSIAAAFDNLISRLK